MSMRGIPSLPSKLASTAVALVLAAGLMAVTAPVALGTTSSCRVRNVTQDTSGRSLIRMVGTATDGDQLTVRGTCAGQIIIGADIGILGRGDAPTLVGRRDRVVKVKRDARVTLEGLRIQGGQTGREGAGIHNRGRLTLVDVLVRRNVAQGLATGGGIRNLGRLRLEDSVIRGNTAASGGGIATNGPRVTILRSLVIGNVASVEVGGGIANRDGLVVLTETRLRANRARLGGGGLWSIEGDVTITEGLVEGNHSDPQIGFGGGGLVNFQGDMRVRDTIVRGNASVGAGGILNARGDLRLTAAEVSDNTARGRGGGIENRGGNVDLEASTVSTNTAGTGGGIWNGDSQGDTGSVTLDGASSVTGNTPDDCAGTAC
jgi:hypothetical protein